MLKVLHNHGRSSHGPDYVWHCYFAYPIEGQCSRSKGDVLVEIRTVYKIYKVVDFARVQTYSMAEHFRNISPRLSFPCMQSRSFYLSQTYLFIRLVEFL